MEEGFDHLRCPMCGGELIYSEGTHDMCCSRNPYESMSAEEWVAGAALRERRAGYEEGGGEGAGEGGGGRLYIYKVWRGGEEGGRLRQSAGGSASIDARSPLTQTLSHAVERGKENETVEHQTEREHTRTITGDFPVPDTPVKPHAEESAVYADAGEVSAGEENKAIHSATPVKGHVKETAVQNRVAEIYSGENERVNPSATPVKTHRCVFAVSFTESARFGTLWSMRIVHAETNYFTLTRLMQKIEKRLKSGEPLAANAPHPPKKREKSAAAKLAWRFGIEEEDVYSIRYSTETVKRLAVFYGITERDVRRIREADVEEE